MPRVQLLSLLLHNRRLFSVRNAIASHTSTHRETAIRSAGWHNVCMRAVVPTGALTRGVSVDRPRFLDRPVGPETDHIRGSVDALRGGFPQPCGHAG